MSPTRYMTEDEAKRFRLGWAVSYAILFLAVLGLFLLDSSHAADAREKLDKESEARDLAICKSGNETRAALSAFLVSLIDKADANIEKTQYYVTHPKEAQRAHEQNEQAKVDIREALKAQNCTMLTKEAEVSD